MLPLRRTDLHAEGEDGDDDLEDEGEGELPQGVVDSGPRRSVRDVVHRPTHVGVVDIITELRRLQSAAVVEELGDELAGAAAGVRVGIRQHGGDARHSDDLQDRVLPQLGGLPPPAPGDVGPDEQSPPESAEHAEQDERDELGHVPRRVVLHVEQHQAAVAKRVDGAQREGGDQGSEEGTPQSLQGEIITDLQERQRRNIRSSCRRNDTDKKIKAAPLRKEKGRQDHSVLHTKLSNVSTF